MDTPTALVLLAMICGTRGDIAELRCSSETKPSRLWRYSTWGLLILAVGMRVAGAFT